MTTINAYEVSHDISKTYTRYLKSLIQPDDTSILRALESAIDQASSGSGGMVKGPFFELTPSYEKSKSSRDLIASGDLSPAFAKLESESFSIDRHWYTHQVDALLQLNCCRNVVVATGTGSGKTESFLLPILNSILNEPPELAGRPGVRALLLYPMNALANDQLKRLRQLLKACPEITFGRYTGETVDDRKRAEEEFRMLHPGEAPLSNELLSREEMQARPPHLLLTNYAMLEYLLLRPEDSALFGDPTESTWRFIVVDEAHMYDGAIGAEIGYLIRRLRSRVSQGSAIQCVATSATLGEDDGSAARFASNLFGVPFENENGDIVSATVKALPSASVWGEIPSAELYPGQAVDGLREVLSQQGNVFASAYDMLAGEQTIREVISLTRGTAKTLEEIRGSLSRSALDLAQLRLLIELASQTVDADGAPLLSGKYHLFARATEGAFVCLNPEGPHVSLARHDRCPECGWRMFELAACQRCGGVHLVGAAVRIGGAHYVAERQGENDRTVWISLKRDQFKEANEDDLTLEDKDSKAPRDLSLCPRCGRVESGTHTTCCDPVCGSKLLPAAQRMVETLDRCMRCGATGKRIIRRFESGNDAAASVLTTSLYQALPPSSDDDGFSSHGGGRKLLVFSDSRQQAAFFAPYLENTYERFVQRRFIYQAVADPIFDDAPASASDIADITKRIASRAGYFSDEVSAAKRGILTATWVQAEMMTLDQRISLEGSGLVKWEMKPPSSIRPLEPLQTFGFTEQESLDLLQILIRSLRLQGAAGALEYVDLKEEIFAPRLGPIRIRSTGADARRKVLSWLPSSAGSGSSSNSRSDFIDRLLAGSGRSPSERNSILEGLWKVLTSAGSSFHSWLSEDVSPQVGPTWSVNPTQIVAMPVTEEVPVWKCDRCGTVTYHNVREVCPRYRCAGTLRRLRLDSPLDDVDHYRHLYRTLLPIPLSATEHTAQWTSREAAHIQQEFTKGRINVLSCSTTFELGVDVGDLQSVVLRNVPPTVSNYTQRSGRAGRRSGTAALVVTYAQRRSHDLAVFANPQSQIGAAVRTPVVPIENPRLAQRHFYSVALAAFWRDISVSTGRRYRSVDDFFSSQIDGEASAARQVSAWLDAHRADIERDIERLTKGAGLSRGDWSWPAWTTALRELLENVERDYQEEVALYESLLQEAYSEQRGARGDYFRRVLNTVQKKPLLGFLANRNVIPKYGFPVDTVEFRIPAGGSDASKLELARDLSQAIFEYAPGSEVVAGGKLWKSAGIARQRERENPAVYYRICRDCDSYTESLVEEHGPCSMCGAKETGQTHKYFEPRFGFVSVDTPGKPGDAAPRVSWKGETRIARDGDVVSEGAIPIAGGEVGFHVMERVQLVRLNPGPGDRGFKICNFCGFALPGTQEWPKSHDDPIRGRPCTGHASYFALAHKFETDVVRIRFPYSWDGAVPRSTSLSVLHAVLQGAAGTLQIAGTNIDGAVTSYHTTAPTIDIVDTVPGGAGYARLIGSALGTVLRGVLQVVETCECGPETSCSMCLRTYSNQRVHDELVRGAAATYLSRLYGA